MQGWYYKAFGSEFGPITLEELVGLAKSHTLSSDDEVRFGDNGQWRRAGSIGQLMAHLPFEPEKKVISGTIAKSESASQTPAVSAQSASSSAVAETGVNAAAAAAAPEEEIRWWCKIEGKEYGPVELPKLIEWAAKGRLHRGDQVRMGDAAYVVASELPGLFPDLPATPSNGSKAEITTKPNPTASASEASPASDSKNTPSSNGNTSTATPSSTDVKMPDSQSTSTPPSPSIAPRAAGMSPGGPASSSPSRPAISVRPPIPKKSSGGIGQMLTSPLVLGIVGAILLGGAITAVVLFVPFGDGGAAKGFKELEKAMADVTSVRKDENVSEKDFKAAADKMAKVARKVHGEVKTSSNANAKKVATLASKMIALPKGGFDKSEEAVKAINTLMVSTKKTLKIQ